MTPWHPLKSSHSAVRVSKMKALIILKEKDCDWLRKVSNKHPAMYSICNKPLIEYLLDFAILNGCSELRIILNDPDQHIGRYFDAGKRWGIDISYGTCLEDESLEQVLDRNSRFCQQSALLICNGFFFVHYDKEINLTDWHSESDTCHTIHCPTGSVIHAPDRSCLNTLSSVLTRTDFALTPLETIHDLYQISMQVLAAEQAHYVLPGYGTEKGILLGRNVEIGKNVTIIEPAIIGNDVELHGETVIGPFTVIGNSVIIDKGTHVTESIVHSHSYLGCNLTIKQKIVKGNKVFSIREDESMVIEEPFLFSPIQNELPLPSLRLISNRLAALFLTLFLCVPYFLLFTWSKISGGWKQRQVTYFLNTRETSLQVKRIVRDGHSFAGVWLGLPLFERFNLLPHVLSGELLLVGNRLLEATRRNSELLADFPEYMPGIFCYSEAENDISGPLETDISERYWAANRTPWHDALTLLKIIRNGRIRHKASPIPAIVRITNGTSAQIKEKCK